MMLLILFLKDIIPLDSFTIKRKFKSRSTHSPNRWWYVVRATEEILIDLINGWSTVASARGWSIDYVRKFRDDPVTPCPVSLSVNNNSVLDPADVASESTVSNSVGIAPDDITLSDRSAAHDDANSLSSTSPLSISLAQVNSRSPNNQ